MHTVNGHYGAGRHHNIHINLGVKTNPQRVLPSLFIAKVFCSVVTLYFNNSCSFCMRVLSSPWERGEYSISAEVHKTNIW